MKFSILYILEQRLILMLCIQKLLVQKRYGFGFCVIIAQFHILDNFVQVLITAGRETWKPSKLEKHQNASNLSENNVHSFVTFWTNEHDKVCFCSMLVCTDELLSIYLFQINQLLVKQTVWDNKFHHLSWRVDVRTESKQQSDINEPIALFELGTNAGHIPSVYTFNNSIQKVKFELNRQQLSEFLGKLEDIQKKIEEFSH